jgi:hypothetical protein
MPLVIFLVLFALFLAALPIWGAFAEEKRVDRETAQGRTAR